MRIKVYFLLPLFALVTACQNGGRGALLVPLNQIISYPLEGHQYVVIVVKDNGVSSSQAKQEAMRQAAQVTLDHGCTYFSVVAEKEVQVGKTSGSEQDQMPTNLYQELIIQKDFSQKDNQQPFVSAELVPAIRLTIECYEEKPAMKKSYNANELLNQ